MTDGVKRDDVVGSGLVTDGVPHRVIALDMGTKTGCAIATIHPGQPTRYETKTLRCTPTRSPLLATTWAPVISRWWPFARTIFIEPGTAEGSCARSAGKLFCVTSTGRKLNASGSLPLAQLYRGSRIHLKIRCAFTSYRCATSGTDTPGTLAWETIRFFSSSLHLRRLRLSAIA